MNDERKRREEHVKEELELEAMREAAVQMETDKKIIRQGMDTILSEDYHLFIEALRIAIQGRFDRLLADLDMEVILDEEYDALLDEFEEKVFDKIIEEAGGHYE